MPQVFYGGYAEENRLSVMTETYTLQRIADIAGGKVQGDRGREIRYLATDSRSLPASGHSLFIAIRGDRHDGHRYIREVYEKGVRAFLVSEVPEPGLYEGAGFCLVEDTLEAMQRLAAERRKAFKGTVIGISGSNGKTIVKEWLFQSLGRYTSVIRSPKSYNSQVGVPLSLWLLGNRHDTAIIEAGISRPGEMERLQSMIDPEIGILTNIGAAHQENFRSATRKLEEKLRLFRNSRKLIYRADQVVDGVSLGEHLAGWRGEKVAWSLYGAAAYRFSREDVPGQPPVLKLEREGTVSRYRLLFTDAASLENLCHVITTLTELGVEDSLIAAGVESLEPVAMRLEILKGIHGSTLVNDTYNSDLTGLQQALDVLNQQKNHESRAVILSDLYQSGLEPEELYREIARMVNYKGIDRFYGIGRELMNYRHYFPDTSVCYPDTDTFLDQFISSEIRNKAVLIKGARDFHFERITGELQLQTHKTVLEIDVNALVSNLNYFRGLLSEGTRIMVMVKALSYGSGSHEIAGLLQHQQVDYLAVAFTDEGVRLRKAGIDLPVMVMNPDPSEYQQLIEYNLEPELFSRRGLEVFERTCRYTGMEEYPVHIKLDTGMHRLGFMEEEVPWLADFFPGSAVRVQSIFSHLAASGDDGQNDFTHHQAARYREMSDRITGRLEYPVLHHLLNSAGIERFPEYQMDMVRLGIGLYGISDLAALEPVSTFRSVVSQIREVPGGDTIGYGRAGKVREPARIATVPAGYADGIDRKLGNGRCRFLVNGKAAPTIGSICMDMTMLDITGLRVEEGDVVEVFGKQQPVTQIAAIMDTIPYEVLTGIPERVKRIYIQE